MPVGVLLSGGLDSATVLAIAVGDGFQPIALSFRYGLKGSYDKGWSDKEKQGRAEAHKPQRRGLQFQVRFVRLERRPP